MTVSRRTMLTGLASLGAAAATPAWAQAIGSQSDPWAQVDPYADPRNGFPSAGQEPLAASKPGAAGQMRAAAPEMATSQGDAPTPPDPQKMASKEIMEALTDPERFEIMHGRNGLYYNTVLAEKKRQGAIVKNAAAQRALRQFSEPFLRVADRSHLPWQVFLTDSEQVNGCAYGGGNVTITAGTVLYADHPAELAALVAHEIGHNDRRHGAETGEIRALMTLAQGGSLQGAESMKAALDKMLPQFEEVLMKGFSRQNEREADAHVVYLFEKVGMDPERYITMFKKMMRVYGIDAAEKTCLMDSHPVIMERIDAIRSQTLGRRYRSDFTPPGWAELKRIYPTPSEYRWG